MSGGFCFTQLAASNNDVREETQRVESNSSYDTVTTYEDGQTTASPSMAGTIKDKLKGFVKNVKEGAADAYETVSDSVSEVAHDINEKGKKAVAGTKKLVNGAIDKIKNTFKNDDETEVEVPRSSSTEPNHRQPNQYIAKIERSSEESDVHDNSAKNVTARQATLPASFLIAKKHLN